jgi:hypothetical protein
MINMECNLAQYYKKLQGYSAFSYARNPSIDYFYPEIYVMLEICAWDDINFYSLFQRKIFYLWNFETLLWSK